MNSVKNSYNELSHELFQKTVYTISNAYKTPNGNFTRRREKDKTKRQRLEARYLSTHECPN